MNRLARPAPIRTDQTNAFAHLTIQVRVPLIIQEIIQLNPDYPPAMLETLQQFSLHLQQDHPLPALSGTRIGTADWQAALHQHFRDTWLNTDWFFAETLVYRYLLDLVNWWVTARDPFLPKKREELHSPGLWDTLDAALTVSADDRMPVDERLATLIQFALWGNRVDLSYALAATHGQQGTADDLPVDNSEPLVRHLLDRANSEAPVDLILDNTGTELAADLVLVDGLLQARIAQVRLHVKYHPTFVSDTTQHDLIAFLTRLAFDRNPERQALAIRLAAALAHGRLEVLPHIFWNSCRFMHELPQESSLWQLLSTSRLVIFKGDANYRRLTGDAVWDPVTDPAQAAAGFPAPLALIRTLKSDPIVGLPAGLAEQLDTVDARWRVNGKRGVIHFALPDADVNR